MASGSILRSGGARAKENNESPGFALFFCISDCAWPSIASYITVGPKPQPVKVAETVPVKRRIRLRGINGEAEGKSWDSEAILRAGRLATLEIVLEDSSVSRRHAEIRATEKGWRVRDLGSTNGTFLNGNRLAPGEWPLKLHDLVRFGNVTMVVEALKEVSEDNPGSNSVENMMVEATEVNSWEEAINGFAFVPEQGKQESDVLMMLLR